jgi:two-component system, NtrC family, sensor histidine kinase HydH
MWKKIVAPVVLVVLLWITVSGVTTYYINWLYESHARVLEENLSSIQAVGTMQATLWRLQTAVMKAAERPRTAEQPEVAELEGIFQRHLGEAEKTAFTPDEQDIIKSIRREFSAYSEHTRNLLQQAPLNSDNTKDIEQTLLLAQAVAEPCKQLLKFNEKIIADATAYSERLGASFIIIRLTFLIAGPAIGILFGVMVARGLHRSIAKISVTLGSASDVLDHEVGRVDIIATDDLSRLQEQVEVVNTRIKQVVEQLQETRHEAIRAERLAAVGQLAAGLAHELRNPLTSMKLLVQNAVQRYRECPLTEKQLQVIQEEIGRMEHTIQGLLDFSRTVHLNRTRHDLRETIHRGVNLVDGRAKQQGVSIHESFPQQPVMIDGDPEQLHQVFVNLLINGLDSMSKGGVLEVAIQKSADKPDIYRISFRDSGCGIPQTVLDRIFEPFVTTKDRGTGLGLAISRSIIKEHNGDLTAANRQNGGAVFTIDLPACSNGAGSGGRKDIDDSPSKDGQSGKLDAQIPMESFYAKITGHR